MRFISTTRTALGGRIATTTTMLGRHRALTRVSLTALAFTLVLPLSQHAATQAGAERPRSVPESLLPATVGLAIATDATVTVPFAGAMDTASVEAVLELDPAQPVTFEWNAEATEVSISPRTRWVTDRTYLISVSAAARRADGSEVGSPSRFAFTTQAAPAVTSFDVDLAATEATLPDDRSSTQMLDADPASAAVRDARTATRAAERVADSAVPSDVSAATTVDVGFSRPMDRSEVEDHFAVNPSAAGDLTWRGNTLVFAPSERLTAGMRYTVSLAGARDLDGNPLGGQTSFSFVVRPGAQLAKTTPESGATDVTDAAALEMWFSQPMDAAASTAALTIADSESGDAIAGSTAWNEDATQLTFTPEGALPEGVTIDVAFADGARDADGNPVAMEWSFTTRAPAPDPTDAATPAATPAPTVSNPTPAPTPAPAPVIPPAAPASSAAGYAVNLINASRAAYGFGPVVLDDTISAVAYAHAYDQAVNGYFSHTGLDGSTRESRLIAGGVSFGWSAENQCYLVGRSPEATLDWCHAQFMAEPYPGHWNHIANVLDPRATRVGVGIAEVGSKIVIVWDFAD